MVALTSADVTATVDKSTRRIGPRGLRSMIVTLAYGDGAKTYPANGVPLPSGQTFFPRGHIEAVDIIDNGASLAMCSYDITHNSIRMVHPTQQTASTGNRDGVEYGGSDAPAATTLKCQYTGW